MLTGIDHVIVATADPDGAVEQLADALGLRAGGGGRHEAHGTFNRLIWLGDSYLELMGVFDAGRAADSWWGRQAIAVIAGGGGLMGLALASDDLPSDVARLRGQGSPITEPLAGDRTRPDGELIRWRIGRLPQPDPDLGLTFLIEHDAAAAEWRPADRAARAAEVHPLGTPARLAWVEVAARDTRQAVNRLLRDLGLQFRPSLAGGGARDSSIGSQLLRLVAGSMGRPAVIVVRAGAEERATDLLGLRWQLLPVGPG